MTPRVRGFGRGAPWGAADPRDELVRACAPLTRTKAPLRGMGWPGLATAIVRAALARGGMPLPHRYTACPWPCRLTWLRLRVAAGHLKP